MDEKVYTNNKFTGFYPVGTAAVVVADDPLEAAGLLNNELIRIGLKATAKADDMERFEVEHTNVRILCDGEY